MGMNVTRRLKTAIQRIPIVQQYVRANEVQKLLAFPERVEIEVTSFCNGRCTHCEHPSLGRPYAHMEMGLYKRVIDECDLWSKHCKEVFLFWMGEPFLDPTFFEKVKYAKQKNSFVVSSYSNGSLLTLERCEKLIESGLDAIVFGTDGATKESYEAVRANLSYDRMTAGISRLANLKKKLGAEKPHIQVQMVLTPYNSHQVGLFKQTWTGVADEISIRKMVIWGGDVIDEELLDYSRKLVGDQYPPSTPCGFLWRLMVIAQDGRVAMCCTDSRIRHEVGDVRKETLAEIWNGKRMSGIRDLHLRGRMTDISLCRTCNHRQIMPYPWWWYRGD